MAGVEQRGNKTTGPTWRVYWRQSDLPGRQYERFHDPEQAERFRQLVEGSGNRWPTGWVKGHGYTGRPLTGPVRTFRDWSVTAVGQRTKANDRSKADYLRDLERHVWPHLGHLPAEQITDRQAIEWVTAMEKSGMAPKTIANIHGLVSSIMADGIRARPPVCDHNPFVGLLRDLPDVKVEEMVFLTPEEFGMVYRHVPVFYKPLTLHLWSTGERYSEATAHQVRDLTLVGKRTTAQVVRAWKRLEDGTHKLGEPKTRRSRRTLPLSDKLVAMLARQVTGRAPSDLVFPAREGGQLLNSTFHDNAWALAVRRAQVCDTHYEQQQEKFAADRAERLKEQRETGRRIRFAAQPCDCPGMLLKTPRVHDLRHSHASQLIAEGLPLPLISRRLGHKSIQVTVDRYGHLMPELDDAVNEAVDRGLAWLDDNDE